MDGLSLNVTADNIARLHQLFPDVLSEGQVDFDRLRAALGAADALAPTSPEHYELRWAGKDAARREVQRPTAATLLPDPARSVDFDTTGNVFIEGENLEVLRVLQRGYFGKVKMIYIDPPYNTGSDSFVYPDDYSERRQEYEQRTGQRDEKGFLNKQDLWKKNTRESGQYHSAWLSMMWPRLYLSRNLLREDGVIFVSIDDNEVHNLRLLMNEVFGEENFLAEIIIETATDNNPGQISKEHEYMLAYAKAKDLQSDWFVSSKKAALIATQYQKLRKKHGADVATLQTELRAWIRLNRIEVRGVEHYDNVDAKGVFHDADVANPKFGGYFYDVPHEKTGRPCKVPEKGYRYPEASMKKLLADGDIMFGDDETTIIKPKKRLENAKDQLRSVIYNDGRAASKRLNELLGRDIFRFPKDENLLTTLLEFTTQQDDLILDFFAGSGTTGHAVLNLNEQDGGNRRFVLVQMPETVADNAEAYKAGYRTIADITHARLLKVSEKLRAAQAGQLALSGPPPDTGFRTYRLDYSNFRAWRPEVTDAPDILAQLELFQEPLLGYGPTGSQENMLTELLLKMAGGPDILPLSVPVVRHDIAGVPVHAVAGGLGWLALAEITPAVVAAAVAARPQRLIVPGRLFGPENPDEQVSNARLQLADAGVMLQLI